MIYTEPGHSLELYLELTGFGVAYGWVGGTEAFAHWTSPEGEAIPAVRQPIIRARVEAWAAKNNASVGFEPPLSPAEEEQRFVHSGYARRVREDGSVMWQPPPRTSIVERVLRLFR